MGSLFDRAVNPHQYDLDDVTWDGEVSLKAPTREHMYHYLSRYKNQWKGADVLDIGCGTGWLLDLIRREGAKSVEGIEPSAKNVALAKEHFPYLTVHHTTAEAYETDKQYDLITSVMVFAHIAEPERAFKNINGWLRTGGEFHLIIPDPGYFNKERPGVKLEYEDLDDGSYVLQITRPEQGVISDIIRPPGVYEKIGNDQGLTLAEQVLMKPTPYLIEQSERHRKHKDQSISQLLRFKK